MSNVRRIVLASAALGLFTAAASAQAPGVRRAVLIEGRSGSAGLTRSPLAVLERLTSFDANGDRRISRDELPERMQGLVARGDKNSDAALDPDEIRALVDAASSEPFRFTVNGRGADNLAHVVSDLKLEPAKHERALAIVSAHTLPANARDLPRELLGEMQTLLDDEDYENFVAAAMRLVRNPVRGFAGTVGGVVPGITVPSGPK